MPPIVIECKPFVPPDLGDWPTINIPVLGTMRMAQDAINAIPDPLDLLAKFQNYIAPLMAPVRYLAEIAQVVAAIVDCITALPKAIMSVSPQPVIDCLKNLIKRIVVLMAQIPPIAYIKTAMDVANLFISIVDALLYFFQRLDEKITEYKRTMAEAEILGDIELIQFVNCSMTQANSSVLSALDLLTIMQPFLDILLEIFSTLMPSPELKKAREGSKDAAAQLAAMRESIVNGVTGIVPLPPLAPMLTAANNARSACVLVYNILAPVIGEEPSKAEIPTPTYNNF